MGRRGTLTVTALDNVNLFIASGQRVGLIGHNGAGKSVLLKVMAGIFLPTSGVCEVRGKISTLFSNSLGINADATGLENITMYGLTLGLSRKEIEERIPEIIEFSELGEYIHMPIRTYSAGMRTRLSFSVSTCISPDVLLIDEVIGAGDSAFQAKARDRLNRAMNIANTLVVASHSSELIRLFCDSALWMHNGAVRAFGEVNEVLGKFQTEGMIP